MQEHQPGFYSIVQIKQAISDQLVIGLRGNKVIAKGNMERAEREVLKQCYAEAKDSLYDVVSTHLGACLWLLEQHQILSGNETKIFLPMSPEKICSNDYSMQTLANEIKKNVDQVENISETSLKDLDDITTEFKQKRDQKRLKNNLNSLHEKKTALHLKRRNR